MTDLAGLPASVRAALHDEAVPDWRTPTLATLTDKRFSDPGWIYERKLDGMRCWRFATATGCGCCRGIASG